MRHHCTGLDTSGMDGLMERPMELDMEDINDDLTNWRRWMVDDGRWMCGRTRKKQWMR